MKKKKPNPSEEESSEESLGGNWQQGSAQEEDRNTSEQANHTEDEAQAEAREKREQIEEQINECHYFINREEHEVTKADAKMLEGNDLYAKQRYKWDRIAEDFRRMYLADTTEQRKPQFIRTWDKVVDAVKKLDEAAETHRKITGRKLNRPHVHIMESADRRHLESSENVPKQRFRRERLREYWKDYYKMTEEEQTDKDGIEQYVRIEKFGW